MAGALEAVEAQQQLTARSLEGPRPGRRRPGVTSPRPLRLGQRAAPRRWPRTRRV